MRMTLARAKGADEEGTLDLNGATLKYTYNPGGISHKEMRRLRGLIAKAQANPEDPSVDWIIPYLVQMLTGWDLLADDTSKKTVPINEETLDALGEGFLSALMQNLAEKLVPPATPELDSGSFS